jgi:alpha-galactosidase
MLYYMPQTWTSDNTDALERIRIQEGAYLFYPLSSISNHVNSNVSHQVLRYNPLETRFNVAAFGTLGYELDVTELTPFDKKIIQGQIAFYKKYRDLFQYGILKRIYHPSKTVWMVHSKDKKTAIMLVVQHRAKANPAFEHIKVPGLLDGMYSVTSRLQYTNIRRFGSLVNEALPIKLKVNHFLHNTIANRYLFQLDSFDKEITGKQLKHMGLLMHHEFTGTGYNDKVMLMPDGGSRMFIFKYIEEEKKDGNKKD